MATDRMGWLCEDCYEWVPTLELAEQHSDDWQHSLAVCPESRRGLRMWIVHDHPLDFPDHWVVRPGRVPTGSASREYQPAPRAWPFETLEACHEFLAPFALTLIQRRDLDEPYVYEVWI